MIRPAAGVSRRFFDTLIFLAMPLTYLVGFTWAIVKYFTPVPSSRKSRSDRRACRRLPAAGEVKRISFNQRDVFVMKEGDTYVAIDSMCPHLNCAVNWKAAEKLFICPCHNGAFHQDGTVARQPPQAPLARWVCIVVGNKVVVLDSMVEGKA